MKAKRILDEPAYVLHRYDWSESSLILEVFTRHHGRIALLAKGAKRPTSNFRPVLLPLQPLRLAFGGEAEIRVLRSAEWQGGHVMPSGDALLSGCYLNELVLTLLARDDAHPVLFDVYENAVQMVAGGSSALLQAALRAFELLLLREVGLLPQLDVQTTTQRPLSTGQDYELLPEAGLREAHEPTRPGVSGAQWVALHRAVHEKAPFIATLTACSQADGALKSQLRALLHYHCGVDSLRTRKMVLDIQSM